MLTRPPREREWISWLCVAVWAVGIFSLIPLARAVQAVVQEQFGRELFAWGVIGAVVVGAAAGTRVWIRHRARLPRSGLVWLLGVAVVFVVYTVQLRAAPEEAVHFVQYGLLGILAYRALAHRLRDPGIYLAAAGVGTWVGALDEAIQWAVPDRFWGLRDIWLNGFAAGLVQVGIARGLRPPLVSQAGTRGLQLALRIWAAVVLLLLACALNTPQRVEWYTARIPVLAFLKHNPAAMLEYGYLYTDDAVVFRSRLAPPVLARTDAARAAEVGAILDRYADPEAYAACLERYRPGNDPFVHEARVHLYRRDRHLQKGMELPAGSPERARRFSIALGEDLVLERYFGNTLRSSRAGLAPQTVQQLRAEVTQTAPYESAVSGELITSVSEAALLLALGAALAALLGLERYVAARASPGSPPQFQLPA